MEQYAELILRVSGYLSAALSLTLIIRCAISMLQEKYEPEIWAYVELPDGSSRAINHWECILGRARSSDVVLPDATVQRSHAALQRSSTGRWTIHDLGSKGGTLVNGKAVEGKAVLNDGDRVRLGAVELRFLALSSEQRKTLQRRRQEPGHRVSAGLSLLLLTIFQALLMLQLTFTTPAEHVGSVCLAFGIVAAVEWFCYFAMRALAIRGFEVETLAFYLSSVGLAVTASSEPSGMVKACFLLLAGVALFVALGWWLRDLQRVKLLRWPMAFAALLFLCVNLALSEEVFGARNWLTVAGITLQPSEFVKIAYAYAGAASLDRLFRRRNLLLYIAFSAFIVGALALMGDFGTAMVFFICFLVVSYMRSGSFTTVFLAVAGAGLAGMLVLTAKPYVARRFAAWGHVWEDPLGRGYQQVRAMSATASGGLFGQGAGSGWLKNVAAADTDLVFGMVSEELGLLVGLCCIAAIILLALFTVRNAAAGRSSFYVIAGCAAATMMMTQVALNVFGSMDILPFTGVTFPFVSKGGSSLISCWAMLAYMKAGDTRRNASFALPSGLRRRLRGETEPEEEETGEETNEKTPSKKTDAGKKSASGKTKAKNAGTKKSPAEKKTGKKSEEGKASGTKKTAGTAKTASKTAKTGKRAGERKKRNAASSKAGKEGGRT